MRKLSVRHVALGLSIAAIAAAGCGSSSKSKTTAAPPATPSTPTTSSTGTTAQLSPSTPIAGTAFKTEVTKAAQQTYPKGSSAQITKTVDCTIKKLQSMGISTFGQVQQRQSETSSVGRTCANQAGLKK